MNGAELWAAWRLWVSVGGAVVVVAAVLLITILVTAKSVLAHAVRALEAAEKIRANTQAIWDLQSTNEVADALRGTVEEMEDRAEKIAEAVGAHAGTGEGG